MLVTYMAVRDADGNYVGTAEFVQDMEFAKEHFLKSEYYVGTAEFVQDMEFAKEHFRKSE